MLLKILYYFVSLKKVLFTLTHMLSYAWHFLKMLLIKHLSV